jgi:pimeloyl-ACP methyl ester carboxylesterase
VTRPRLLLTPSFTEVEWAIRPALAEWADLATFDMPGVGGEPAPPAVSLEPARTTEMLSRWRDAGARRGIDEVERRGWSSVLLVADGHGTATAVRIASELRGSVLGLAIGHAALSHSTAGDRPPMNAAAWAALAQLARQGNDAFVRYGIAQMTQGGVSEDMAEQMLERFPDMELVAAMVEALGEQPEPIGAELAKLDLPLLLGKHEGCLGYTDEGFEDIVSAFPDARTVICPEACTASTAFADAVRRFATELER